MLRSVLNERVRYLFSWKGNHRCLNTTVLDTRAGAVRKAEGSGEVQRGGTIGDNMGGVRRVYNGEE